MRVEKYSLAQYSSPGVQRNASVPQSMYVSFKGSVRVPRFV